jgi:hypothetical protein
MRTISALSVLKRATAVVGAVLLLVPSAGCSRPDINEHYTDVEALAAFESIVADSVEGVEGFPGFHARYRELRGCFYQEDGEDPKEAEDHSRVSLEYSLAVESSDDPASQATAAGFEERWTGFGWEPTVVRDEVTGDYSSVSVITDTGNYLVFQTGLGALDVNHRGCVAIDEDPITPVGPVGGVPLEYDTFENFSNRENPDDEV